MASWFASQHETPYDKKRERPMYAFAPETVEHAGTDPARVRALMTKATEGERYSPWVRLEDETKDNYGRIVRVWGFRGPTIQFSGPNFADNVVALALVWNAVPALLARIEQLEGELAALTGGRHG